MSNTVIGKIVIFLLTIICVVFLVFTDFGNRTVRYDCRDAHWHPDVPIEVKKQCQELMRKELQEKKKIVT